MSLCFRQLPRTAAVALLAWAVTLVPVVSAQDARPQAAAPSQAWLAIIRGLQDPKADTRIQSLVALNRAGYGAEANDVAPLLADADVNVRFAAIDAELTFFLNTRIGEVSLDGKAPKKSRAQDAFEAGPLVRNGAVAPPAVIDGLVHALTDASPRIRFDALHALGVIVEPPVSGPTAAALANGLDSSDATTRIATARVLGRLRVSSSGEKLIAALNESNRVEQKYATEALGLIKEPRAVSALLTRLDFYKTGDMAAETLLALARIGHPSARAAFRAHLSDPDPAMRVAALEGLGRLKDTGSRDALGASRDKDSSAAVRLAACFALSHLENPDAPALARGLMGTDTYGQAVDYLLELGPAVRSGVETTLATARDNTFRADLIHVLGFIGTRDTVSGLQPFLKDPNDAVAHAAGDAIARLSR